MRGRSLLAPYLDKSNGMSLNNPDSAPQFRPNLDERFWLMRNLALGIVEHLEIQRPPVKIEGLLAAPPMALEKVIPRISRCLQSDGPCEATGDQSLPDCQTPAWEGSAECRYCACRRMLAMFAWEQHGRGMGLPMILAQDAEDCQDYFARVILAPDALVHRYRSEGRKLGEFANAFVIPHRVAFMRWMDPIFPGHRVSPRPPHNPT